MNALLVVAFLVLPMALPALAVSRSPWVGVWVAPLLTALACTVGAIIALLTSSSLVPWTTAFALVANAVAVAVLRARTRDRRWLPDRPIEVAVIALLTLPPLLYALRGVDIAWDARLMWLAHARWYVVGGDYARRQLPNAAVWGYSNDYPPLVNATVAMMWRATGQSSYRAGQITIGLLNGSALVLFAWSLRRVFVRVRGLLPALLAGLVGFTTLAVFGTHATNAYADPLAALTVVAGTVLLLLAPRNRRDQVLGIVLLLVAAHTKTEGFVGALAVLAAAAWRFRATIRSSPQLVATVAPFLVWPATVRALHATTHFVIGHAPGALVGRGNHLADVHPIERAVVQQDAWLFIGAAVSALLLLTLRSTTRRLGMGPPVLVIAVAIAITAALFLSYMVDVKDVHYYLGISVKRTTIAIRLLAISVIAVGFGAGLVELLPGSLGRPGTGPPVSRRSPRPSRAAS